MDFRSKFAEKKAEKGVLCISIDPILPEQELGEAIPKKYIGFRESSEARLEFCLRSVTFVKDHAVAVKINQQFVSDFTEQQNKLLTDWIGLSGLLSIKDCKLNDLGNAVSSAVFHIANEGYDAITFNPLLGNLQEGVKFAHKKELGVLVLTLTSNPEAETFMRGALVNGRPMYEAIATQVRKFDADGCVVGATKHVTNSDVAKIVELAGEDKIIFVPGVGTQKGDPSKFEGQNVMINVGRDIVYNKDPSSRDAYYDQMLSGFKRVK